MGRVKKPHHMHFGPPMPLVPMSDFSKMKLSKEDMARAWQICGPSIEINMRRGFGRRGLELWEVMVCAYLEGLQHGYGIAVERMEKGE